MDGYIYKSEVGVRACVYVCVCTCVHADGVQVVVLLSFLKSLILLD